MPEEQNRVLFGAEFDGQQMAKGVDEVLDSLEKAQEAEALLKETIEETTAAMKENRKEAEKLAKSKPLNPQEIEKQAAAVAKLNEQYDALVQQQSDLAVASKKVDQVQRQHLKTQREQEKSQNAVNKAASKFLDVNELAADGVKKFGNAAKNVAFSFVSGFAGGIIGTVVPSLIQWVTGMIDVEEEMTKLKQQKEILNGVFTQAAKAVGDDVAKLEVYRQKLNDTNIPAADRIRIAKEYNKTADETNKIDLKQIDNLDLINERIAAQNKLILQRAISTAALAKLTEASTKFVDAQLKLDEELKRSRQTEDQLRGRRGEVANRDIEVNNRLQQSMDGYRKTVEDGQKKITVALTKEERDMISLMDTRDLAKAQLDELAALLNPLITPDGLTTRETPTTPKQVENVFLQKLAEFRARLANASASVFQSETLIQKKFEEQLNKEFFEIGKLLREKKLTVRQADILKGVLKQINDIELTKGLEEFRKKREEALKKINDQIIAVQVENETKRIANIRDEFQREREEIDANYAQSVQQIKAKAEEFRKAVDAETDKGLISPAVAKRKKFMMDFFFGGLLDKAQQAKNNADLNLAFKTFQRTLDLAKNEFEDAILEDNESATRAIREQVGLFLEGKQTYEQYQKNLTAIIKRESRERKKTLLDEYELQLELVQKQLAATTDPAQIDQLTKQRDALRAQISTLKREVATGAAEDDNQEEKERIDKLLQYVNAVNTLATAVLSFWQQVNQAEAAALDRSIALQNKRVENAREIAEAGNAEYLEMEQKRLDELERKREANARKQLAINNALATSQAIVAAITAIAQAVQTGSPFAAIAAVAAVIGAIGAAYQFVNSLQPQEANFYQGTEYVQGPEGRDKVRANLTKGERVVTAKDNKDYWETLSAIHNRQIPPDALNRFVEAYPTMSVPMVDFDRLSGATDERLGGDSIELLGRVDRLNDTMERVVVGLDELGVNVHLDERGFEASISKARKRRLRNYHS